ncbi:MAG: hypothetical protein ABI197_06930 [Granulicella sp.]
MQKFLVACSLLAIASLSLYASAAEVPKANFILTSKTEVPGQTLQPGNYSIQVVGQLTDRLILRVDDAARRMHVDFIGIRSSSNQGTSSSGLKNWDTPINNSSYVRGWVPPGGSSMIEFVYPKAQAVSIAKANHATVAAIDPASEGRATDPSISKSDMELVTLWMLSPTQVGSNGAPSITAERYQTALLVQQKPAIAKLPHTASALPLILTLSLISLLAAFLIRQRNLLISSLRRIS